MYATTDPTFTPPAGVLMWSFGTAYVTKLSAAQQARIGADVAARITYHAQCDNYDRIGGVFFVVKPRDETPKPADARTELVRFITPFSNYKRGALATFIFPDADLSAYARTLADPTHDVWIGHRGRLESLRRRSVHQRERRARPSKRRLQVLARADLDGAAGAGRGHDVDCGGERVGDPGPVPGTFDTATGASSPDRSR